jgi:excisionase family DNA binding protein
MAQTLRDWYRYLERQMHVSLPTVAMDSAAPPVSAAPRSMSAVRLPERVPADVGATDTVGPPSPLSQAALEAAARAEAVRRRLGAGPDQRTLSLELGPRARGRGGRRPITESREEIIRRLLDPELSLHEAAAVLNLSKATVRRYTDHGKLPCLRTEGGQRRFRLSALLVFLDGQTQGRGATG